MRRLHPSLQLLVSLGLLCLVSACAKPIPLGKGTVESLKVTIDQRQGSCTREKPCVATVDNAAHAQKIVDALRAGRVTEPVKCAAVGALEIRYASAAPTRFEIRCADGPKLIVSDSQRFYAIPKAEVLARGTAAKVDLAKLLP